MTPLILWIPGNPVPKGRPRFSNGVTHTDSKTRQAEETIQWRLKKERVKPFEGELSVEIHFHRADRYRCDIDNLQKLVLDSFNGFVWKDDSQIVELKSVLERGQKEPGTWVKVEEVA